MCRGAVASSGKRKARSSSISRQATSVSSTSWPVCLTNRTVCKMSVNGYLALLCDQRLFMCRLDKFDDRWEGVWPEPIAEQIRSSSDMGEPALLLQDHSKVTFFVSCWHSGAHESAALWDLYSGQAGLAIRTTCRKLKSAVHSDQPFYIGHVSYYDYAQEDSIIPHNSFLPVFSKRKSFEHEREVRALVWDLSFIETDVQKDVDWSKAPQSVSLAVDLETLIDCIHLSPAASTWLLPSIREVASRFGLPDVAVEKSTLYDEHVY